MSGTSGSQCSFSGSQFSLGGSQCRLSVSRCRHSGIQGEDIGTLCGHGCSCHNRKRDCCLQHTCGKPDTRPWYARTTPEKRQYGVVVSNESGSVDAKMVMQHLFLILERHNVPELNFSPCVPISGFDGKILLVCEDAETTMWLLSAIASFNPPHQAVPFINFFGLMRATVVLPFMQPKESTCAIFGLLEQQNENIKTDKWAVVGRNELNPCDRNHVGAEVLELYIDAESRQMIECQCSKMRYQSWTVEFKF